MFARMATPLLGGAPAVWNVTLVCFQAALLLGYGYAHLLSRVKDGRLQVLIHAAVLLVGFACLPLQLSQAMGEPDARNPALWLVGTFAISIAPPFAALSATAPLVQHWYAKSGLSDAADPYHLYAASNVGSLVGLAAYPLLIEPFATLATQSQGWMAGYALLAAGLLFAGWSVGPARVLEAPNDRAAPAAASITWARRLKWLALAFAPSSLLLGVTSHITTDIAAAPFLWAPPLMIYLLTFIVAFAKKPVVPHRYAVALSPLAAALSIYMISVTAPGFIWLGMASSLLALFVIALACHGALNQDRPDARRLTEFYLIMSLGGVLGGAFNALLAPLIFSSIVEYPLMLVASIALLAIGQRARLRRLTIYLLVAAVIALQVSIGLGLTGTSAPLWLHLLLLLPSLAAIATTLRAPIGAAIALALSAPVGPLLEAHKADWSARSFFGIVRIVEYPDSRALFHGTTLHGAQLTSGPDLLQPITYYGARTPIGQAFNLYADAKSVGVVGLGIGSSACYGRPGQQWTYYEIDPLVVKVATDSSRFTYMFICQPDARIEIGDARVNLAHATRTFDLLLLDAFSSDSVPTHLLTVEAMKLYMDRLGDDGVLLVHISNRHLSLAPIVARGASAVQAGALMQNYSPGRAIPATRPASALSLCRATQPRSIAPVQPGSGGNWKPTAAGRGPTTTRTSSAP